MATGYLIQDLADAVSCEICNEPFTEKTPRILNCMHVFCEDCIQNLLVSKRKESWINPNAIKCIICRKISDVPRGLSSNLTKDFCWKQIEEIRRQFEDIMYTKHVKQA